MYGDGFSHRRARRHRHSSGRGDPAPPPPQVPLPRRPREDSPIIARDDDGLAYGATQLTAATQRARSRYAGLSPSTRMSCSDPTGLFCVRRWNSCGLCSAWLRAKPRLAKAGLRGQDLAVVRIDKDHQIHRSCGSGIENAWRVQDTLGHASPDDEPCEPIPHRRKVYAPRR